MTAPYTVLSIGDDDAHAWRTAALATMLPRAEVRRVQAELVRQLPAAAALIVDTPALAMIARATGFTGGIVVDGTLTDADAVSLGAGVVPVTRAAGALGLAEALAVAIPLGIDGAPTPIGDDLARTRQLVAAGEVALSAQHAFNNPLTALMAEAQILQMEATSDEVRETAGRMVDLTRRLMEISRSLDGVRDRLPGL